MTPTQERLNQALNFAFGALMILLLVNQCHLANVKPSVPRCQLDDVSFPASEEECNRLGGESSVIEMRVTCPSCKGTGRVSGWTCATCQGEGKILHKEKKDARS